MAARHGLSYLHVGVSRTGFNPYVPYRTSLCPTAWDPLSTYGTNTRNRTSTEALAGTRLPAAVIVATRNRIEIGAESSPATGWHF